MKKITVLGGGTGTFVVLSGLKSYDSDLGVIVSMMDSGGSTGRLRDQLGVLPPGDLRQCLVALSDAPVLWRKLFLYRFEKGDLAGHNFGNIFLSALEKVSANYQEVIETASYVLKTKGDVIPVTYSQTHLGVEYEDGTVIKGEGLIEDETATDHGRIKRAFLEPVVSANEKTVQRILESDLIIIGPGDLYTSIIPIFLIPEIKKSLLQTKAKIVYVVNLMTKFGQTTNYKASDHLRDLEQYIGRIPDYLIVNNGKIDPEIVQWYAEYKEKPVENDLNGAKSDMVVIEDDLIDRHKINKSKADSLVRSILRHDSEKLAQLIQKI